MDYPVRIEGPEFVKDYTYYLIDKMPDLTNLERGIPLTTFADRMNVKRMEIEFRTLQKICFHKDHVLNLFTSLDVKFHKLNRYKDILPYVHNRVVLKECPVLLAPQVGEQNLSPIGSEEAAANKAVREDLAEMEMHGSDKRLRTFFNASYINSLVKSRQ